MKNDCKLDLELCLHPATSSDSGTDISGTHTGRWDGYGRSHRVSDDQHNQVIEQEKKLEETKCGEDGEQLDQLTIFYNGRVCVCDVTEPQAQAIIMVARKEVEDRMKTNLSTDRKVPIPAEKTEIATATTLQSQLQCPTGISMRKSLQRFLQKRKHRIVALSPYGHK